MGYIGFIHRARLGSCCGTLLFVGYDRRDEAVTVKPVCPDECRVVPQTGCS